MSPVFLDTVGLIALWDQRDQWHADAEKAMELLMNAGRPFGTTSFVLLECGNAAARQPYRADVELLRGEMDAGGMLVRPTEEDWRRACQAYREGGTNDAGVIDHVSFVVMRRFGINEAFTNDRHFRSAGFNTLF